MANNPWKPCNNCPNGVTSQEIYENTMYYADMPNRCYKCIKDLENGEKKDNV